MVDGRGSQYYEKVQISTSYEVKNIHILHNTTSISELFVPWEKIWSCKEGSLSSNLYMQDPQLAADTKNPFHHHFSPDINDSSQEIYLLWLTKEGEEDD